MSPPKVATYPIIIFPCQILHSRFKLESMSTRSNAGHFTSWSYWKTMSHSNRACFNKISVFSGEVNVYVCWCIECEWSWTDGLKRASSNYILTTSYFPNMFFVCTYILYWSSSSIVTLLLYSKLPQCVVKTKRYGLWTLETDLEQKPEKMAWKNDIIVIALAACPKDY